MCRRGGGRLCGPLASSLAYHTTLLVSTHTKVLVRGHGPWCILLIGTAQLYEKPDGKQSVGARFVAEDCSGTDRRPRYPEARLVSSRVLVAVVDDDESIREAMPDYLSVHGCDALAFASAEEFLHSGIIDRTRCLFLDIALPGMSGPELFEELRLRGHAIATVFISARMTEDVRADLLRRGALFCLAKPFSDTELRTALRMATGAA